MSQIVDVWHEPVNLPNYNPYYALSSLWLSPGSKIENWLWQSITLWNKIITVTENTSVSHATMSHYSYLTICFKLSSIRQKHSTSQWLITCPKWI
jgi:uracil DNA glycosylase